MIESTPKTLAIGLISLLLCSVATVVSGFVVGFEATNDLTLLVMAAMFMYPSPYLLLMAIGGAIYHTKQWPPIALTFNVAGVIMLGLWVANILVFDAPSTEHGNPLNEALFQNFLISGLVFLVLITIIIVEAQIAWPNRKLEE